MPLRLARIFFQPLLMYHFPPWTSMYVWQPFLLGSLTLLLWTSLVTAAFYIDNANSSVRYYSLQNSAWKQYGSDLGTITLYPEPRESVTVSYETCYNETYCLGRCMTDDECEAQIPFAGTGITIYVTNAGFQGVNASLSVDGVHSINGTIPPPTSPSYQTPRVSLLAIQSLAYAYHIATLSILDWDGGNTSLYFDYAMIEDSTATSQPLTPTPTTSAIPSLPSTFLSMPSVTMLTATVLLTKTARKTTTRTTTAATSHTSASLSSTSSCSHCLRVVEIAVPCAISALLVTGAIFYLKLRRARAKKEADGRKPEPFTVVQRSPLPLAPAAEEKARIRAAQSRVLGVRIEACSGDTLSVRDGLFPGCSSDVGREYTTGSEESSEPLINDCAHSATSVLSDTVVAPQSNPFRPSSIHTPPPSYSDRGLPWGWAT
ncbi:hypothetical protein EDC04DRAFT_2695214 [Pisolithus marmoratus]|nr:hypothetical protein EDC04DRAFT_2695214 [Pisolithus marmoratus]